MGVIFGKKIGPYRPDLERVSRLGKLFFNIFKLVLNLVESFDHGCRRLVRVKQADHDDGNEGEYESGDDFIHSPPCALMPDKNRQSTDDNADQSTVAGDAFPQKRKDDDRAEGSTEAAPGVAHQRENQVVRICSNQDCDSADGNYGQAADPDEFSLSSVRTNECAVKVFCQNGRANQQLA